MLVEPGVLRRAVDRRAMKEPIFTLVGAILLALALAAGVAAYFSTILGPVLVHILPGGYGLLALIAFYGIATWVKGSPNLVRIVEGGDGRPSTSQFQFFVWNAVVLFGVVTYAAARVQWAVGQHKPVNLQALVSDFPANVLMAVGFSAATFAGAKGITLSYMNAGMLSKDPGPAGGIASSDDGQPDLTKIQMLAWTLVAAVVFIYRIANANPGCVPSATVAHCFPDIDGALMVLMGLGHGAYLGNKLASVSTVGAAPDRIVPNQHHPPNPPRTNVTYEEQLGSMLCWAACTRMVGGALGVSIPSQCELAEQFTDWGSYLDTRRAEPIDPSGCRDAAGRCLDPLPCACNYSLDTQTGIPAVYNRYNITAQSFQRQPQLEHEKDVIHELTVNKKPVEVLYRWNDASQHVAVISSYDPTNQWYEVDDPQYGRIYIDYGEILEAYNFGGAAANFWTF
jgi:hypothetical protein